jgi:hypothetical protein
VTLLSSIADLARRAAHVGEPVEDQRIEQDEPRADLVRHQPGAAARELRLDEDHLDSVLLRPLDEPRQAGRVGLFAFFLDCHLFEPVVARKVGPARMKDVEAALRRRCEGGLHLSVELLDVGEKLVLPLPDLVRMRGQKVDKRSRNARHHRPHRRRRGPDVRILGVDRHALRAVDQVDVLVLLQQALDPPALECQLRMTDLDIDGRVVHRPCLLDRRLVGVRVGARRHGDLDVDPVVRQPLHQVGLGRNRHGDQRLGPLRVRTLASPRGKSQHRQDEGPPRTHGRIGYYESPSSAIRPGKVTGNRALHRNPFRNLACASPVPVPTAILRTKA